MRLFSYAASANCLKVRLLLRLLAMDVELVETDIFAGETLTDAFAARNPVRETPVLELDDGTNLTQSNAILGYLAEGTPWAGATRTDRALVAAWMCVEQERVMPAIGGARFRRVTGRLDAAALAPRIAAARDVLDLLQAHLAGRDWLVGATPTVADLSVWAYGHLSGDIGLPQADWPAVAAWSDRLRALPGFAVDLAPYGENARPGAGRSIYD